jgi:hypothetical protein
MLKIWIEEPIKITTEKEIRRYSFSNLSYEIAESFDLDKGLLFTIRSLFTNPSEAIKGYLDTDRLRYSNPFKYFLLIVGITTFISIKIDFWKTVSFSNTSENAENLKTFNQIYQDYFLDYLNIWFGFAVIFTTLFSFLFFKKSGYNIIEHFIINIYIFSQQSLIFIFLIVIMKIYPGTLWLYFALTTVYAIWCYNDIFEGHFYSKLFKSILVVSLSTMLYFLVTMSLMVLIMILLK